MGLAFEGRGSADALPLAGDGAARPVAPPPPPVSPVATINFATLGGIEAGALVEGHRWQGTAGADGRVTVTYSFIGQSSEFTLGDAFASSAQALGTADRALVRQALAAIEAVAAVHFVEVADTGADGSLLRYGYSQRPNDLGFAGYTFYPSDYQQAGDVWLGDAQAAGLWDFYRPNLVLHETLHALGLKHPFDGVRTLAAADDVIPNTVMSYSVLPGTSHGMLSAYPTEPMVADVQALQLLYGAASHEAGDTAYRLDEAAWRTGFHVIWDSGGTDVLDAHAVAGSVSLDLAAGGRSDIGVAVTATASLADGTAVTGVYRQTLAIAQGAVIEHAVGGAYADVLKGNDAGNALVGGGGDDRLLGLGGDDWLAGGDGNNWLDGGAGIDTAYFARSVTAYDFSADAGHIYVRDLVTGTVDTLTGIERAVFADFTFSPGGLPAPATLVGMPALA